MPALHSVRFDATGGTQTFTLPAGLTGAVTFDICGASGGGAQAWGGGRVTGTLAESDVGDVLTVYVGQQGAVPVYPTAGLGGWGYHSGGAGGAGIDGPGSGGGGSSALVKDGLFVAEAGGGGGYGVPAAYCLSQLAYGGRGGLVLPSPYDDSGCGVDGGTDYGGFPFALTTFYKGPTGGKDGRGTNGAGGTPGGTGGAAGGNATAGNGGNAGGGGGAWPSPGHGGGGGGGGTWGGGGGASSDQNESYGAGGGGGGGSSASANATGVTFDANGYGQMGNGYVLISYFLSGGSTTVITPPPVTVLANPAGAVAVDPTNLLADPGFDFETLTPAWSYGRGSAPETIGHGRSRQSLGPSAAPPNLLSADQASLEGSNPYVTPVGPPGVVVTREAGAGAASDGSWGLLLSTSTNAAPGTNFVGSGVTTQVAYMDQMAGPWGPLASLYVSMQARTQGPAARTVGLYMAWYNSSGVLIAGPGVVTGLASSGGWTTIANMVAAPASAAWIQYGPVLYDSGTGAGEACYFDNFRITPTPLLSALRPVNLLPPMLWDFETGESIGGFIGVVYNCAASVISSTAINGNHALQMASTGGTFSTIEFNQMACSVGQTYTAVAVGHNNGAATRSFCLVVVFYAADHSTVVSFANTALANLAPGTNALLSLTVTVPLGAAWMTVKPQVNSPVNGENYLWDMIGLFDGAFVHPTMMLPSGSVGYLPAPAGAVGPGPGFNLLSAPDSTFASAHSWSASTGGTVATSTAWSVTGAQSGLLTATGTAAVSFGPSTYLRSAPTAVFNGAAYAGGPYAACLAGGNYLFQFYCRKAAGTARAVTPQMFFFDATGVVVGSTSGQPITVSTTTTPLLVSLNAIAPVGSAWVGCCISLAGGVAADAISVDLACILASGTTPDVTTPAYSAPLSNWTGTLPAPASASQTVSVSPGSRLVFSAAILAQNIARPMIQILWRQANGSPSAVSPLPTTMWMAEMVGDLGRWHTIVNPAIAVPSDAATATVVISAGVELGMGQTAASSAGFWVDDAYLGPGSATTDEFWMADAVVLNTMAYNVETLAGTANLPVRRGSNYVAPFARGSQFVRKYFDEAKVSLAMWARDAAPSGARPGTEVARRAQMNANEDVLRSVFGQQDRLIDLIHVTADASSPSGYTAKQIAVEATLGIAFVPDSVFGREMEKAAVDLGAPDPFWYSPRVSALLTPSSPTATLINTGTVDSTRLVVVLAGPFATATVTNESNGYSVTITPGPTAEYWQASFTLDCDTFAAYGLGPGDNVTHAGGREWLRADPGPQTFTLGVTGGVTDQTYALVGFRPAYLA